MAYTAIYVFNFESVNGTHYRITISQDGYEGDPMVRRLGGSPTLRRDTSDHIWGTSLEIPAECTVDGEFAALYTADPKEYLVTLDRSNAPSLTRKVIWSGYVSTELYSEPDIAPPYDVQITSTDCIGELKSTKFVGGSRTLKAHIEHILYKTGQDLPIRTASALTADTLAADDLLFSVVVDYTYLDGVPDYDVLQSILSGINACITRMGDAWLIFRQTDISSLEGTSRTGERLVRLRNITTGTNISTHIREVTSMDDGDNWPVGKLSTSVVPAKSSGVVRAPYHVVASALADPDMDTDTIWTTSGNALWESDEDGNGWYRLRKDEDTTQAIGGSISQQIAIDSPNYPMRLIIKARIYDEGRIALRALYVHIDMACKDGNDDDVTLHFGNRIRTSTYFYTPKWTARDAYYEFQFSSGSSDTESDLVELELLIPFSAAALGEYHDLSSLTFTLEARTYDCYTLVSHCSLSAADAADGELATVYLDNGARGMADTVELGMSDTVDYSGPQSFFQGFPSIAGSTATEWSTPLLDEDTYLNIMAQDYAMGWALPRLRKEGALNVPANSEIPIFVESGEIDYIVETFSWDLYNDELGVSMLSLPAVDLDVQSIDTASYEIDSRGSVSTGGASSSMSQKLSGYATLSDLAALAVTVESNTDRIVALEDLFEIDIETGAIRTKNNRPFYTNSWLSAFGVSSGSGSGGSGDTTLAGVWESLSTATDAYASTKINIAHIPAFTVTSSGSGNVVSGITYSNGTFTLTKTQISTDWDDITDKPSLVAVSDLHAVAFYSGAFTGTLSYDTTETRAVYIPTTLDHITDGTNRKLSDYALAADLTTLQSTVTSLAATVSSVSDRLTAIENLFELVPVTIGGTTTYAVHVKGNYGFYGDSFGSFFGVSDTSGSGSG